MSELLTPSSMEPLKPKASQNPERRNPNHQNSKNLTTFKSELRWFMYLYVYSYTHLHLHQQKKARADLAAREDRARPAPTATAPSAREEAAKTVEEEPVVASLTWVQGLGFRV